MKKISLLIVSIFILGVSCKKHTSEENTPTSAEVEQKAKEKEAEKSEKVETTLRHSMEFTAFKTPQKVGVKGTFDDIKLTNTKEGTITEVVTGAHFTVNTASVNSKDPTRDSNLKQFYFDNLAEDTITGTFKSFDNGKATVSIKMNGVQKDIIFDYTATESEILLSGTIDMIKDFSTNEAFEAIHKACEVLHENKTWTDVNINVTIGK